MRTLNATQNMQYNTRLLPLNSLTGVDISIGMPHSLLLQIAPLKKKLAQLQSGTVVITKEQRDAVEKVR